MECTKLIDKLELKHRYQVLVYTGLSLFFISLFVEIKGTLVTNGQLQIGAAGLFCLGLGQWICWGKDVRILPPNVYYGGRALKLERDVWRFNLIGIILDLVGLALVVVALLSIFGVLRTF